ncbi:MAG: hypothetical protein U5K38_11105 [Woeseiaceae bacterium]|nr:hypothetical protein [Woeseiaceae bacterium]
MMQTARQRRRSKPVSLIFVGALSGPVCGDGPGFFSHLSLRGDDKDEVSTRAHAGLYILDKSSASATTMVNTYQWRVRPLYNTLIVKENFFTAFVREETVT